MTINSMKVNNHCNFCVNNGLIYKELCPYFISEQINAPTIKEIEEMKERIDQRIKEWREKK